MSGLRKVRPDEVQGAPELGTAQPVLRARVLMGLELGLERTDEALDALEEAVTVRAADLIWLAVRPLYEPLRRHPRFQAIVARVRSGAAEGG